MGNTLSTRVCINTLVVRGKDIVDIISRIDLVLVKKDMQDVREVRNGTRPLRS